MHNKATQLTLGLSLQDEATFANFYPGRNEEALLALQCMLESKTDQFFFLSGSKGEGCSHLLQACCHHAFQKKLTSVYLPLGLLHDLSPQILDGFESLDVVCLDDLHLIAGQLPWEESIFHLFNRIYDSGGKIIFAANQFAKHIPFTLPDLTSRLSLGIAYQLSALYDHEKLQIVIQRAYQRGMTLSEEVGKFILTHCPRHMGSLIAALDTLDNASLAAQRRLTIPFVKEVLQI